MEKLEILDPAFFAMQHHQPQPIYSPAYPAHILNNQQQELRIDMYDKHELDLLANAASRQYFELNDVIVESELDVWRRNANGPPREPSVAENGKLIDFSLSR